MHACNKKRLTDTREWVIKIDQSRQLRCIPSSCIAIIERTARIYFIDGFMDLYLPSKIESIPPVTTLREINAIADKYRIENSNIN